MTNPKKLLRELIALPSVNPAFVPGRKGAGEKDVADFLAATAGAAGLDVELQEVFPGRCNLLARLAPKSDLKQRVLLAPHMDTVAAVRDEQFVPREKSGRLYGRGACDTKGSIAAMLAALCAVAQSKNRPRHTEIVFAALVDEENAQSGSRALVAGGFKADLAIVGEPTRLQIVTAHKGNVWLRFETFGKAAHGARPELGRNAIHIMSRLVHLLETVYAAKLRRHRHPLVGSPTISVGTINGGSQANIVPDHCVAVADRRVIPGETEADIRRELKALLRHNRIYAKIDNTKGAPCLPLETDPSLPLVRQFLRAAGQKKATGVDYFCDASVLAHGGIPSVVFGPGDIAQAHTADEWIELASLRNGTALLKRFLQELP